MSLFNKLKEKLNGTSIRQFIKFGLVGVSNSLVSLAIYYLFIFINPNLYIVGNTVGYFVSILNAYFWNNKFVFTKKEETPMRSFVKTFASYGITFVIQTALLYIMVDILKISDIIAPLINILITLPINFLLNKLWAFKDKGNKTEENTEQ